MDGDEELLVQEADMEMASTALPTKPTRRLAYLLSPLPHHGSAPNPPPFGHAAAFLAAEEPRVAFKGWSGAPRHWEEWVARLRARHGDLWRKVGILDAILASTYRVKRDSCSLFGLVFFWCGETNTFAFPWGEATVTLEDVAVLGGLPLSGAPVRAPLPQEWRAVEAALNEVRLGFNRSSCKKAHHSAWMKHFFGGSVIDVDLEHAAFLSLWLSRFVFPEHPEMTMRQAVFPLAVRLARGERVALAPAVLAGIYCDLRKVRAYLCGGKNDLPLVVYAPLYILQIWVWERFPALRPKMGSSVKDGEPRAARWHEVVGKKLEPALVHAVLELGREFVWQPYGTGSFAHACKNHSGWVRGDNVARNAELRSFAHCLRACELVGMDCIEQYLPHRVAMQFGLDQDVPGTVARADSNWVVAWDTYEIEGKNVVFFVPQSKPEVTARYVQWWKQQMSPSSSGLADIVRAMSSKRKVKKTPAAAEAEAEKERKMKKTRMLANDKKRKLEDLYDAKLSDWLSAKNGSSDGKRGCPKSEKASEKVSTDDVEVSKDQIPLLMLKKQKTPPVMSKTDKKMKLAKEDKEKAKAKPGVGIKEKCVEAKGDKKDDGDRLVKRMYRKKEKNAVVATEGSAVTKDAKGVESGVPVFIQPVMSNPCCIVEDTKTLVSGNSPDVSAVPDEDIAPMLEKEQEVLNGHVNNGSEEKVVTGEVLAVKKMNPNKEKMEILEEAGQENAVAEKVGRINEGQVSCAEAAPKNKEEVDGSVTNNGSEEIVVAEEVLPVEQVIPVGECTEVFKDVKEDSVVAAEVEGTNDGESPCGEVVIEGPKELPQVEQAEGGESKGMTEKDTEEKHHETPRVEQVECEEANVLTEKDTEEEPKEVSQVEQEEGAGGGSLTERDMEEVPKEVPKVEHTEVEEGKGLTEKGTVEKPEEVPQVKQPVGEEAKGLAEDTEDNTEEVPQVEQAGVEGGSLIEEDVEEKPSEVPQVEQAESGEGEDLPGKDIEEEAEEVRQVEQAEEGECKVLAEKDIEENTEDVPRVQLAEEGQCKALTENYIEENIEEVPQVEQAIEENIEEGPKVEQAKGECEGLTEKDIEENPEEIRQGEPEETEEKDTVEASKNSISGEFSCTSAAKQPKEGEKKEVSDDGMKEKPCIEDVELTNEKESSSDAAAMEVDETGATEGIKNQETLVMEEVSAFAKSPSEFTVVESDKALLQEQAMEERQDHGITDENKKRILEDVNMVDSAELKSDAAAVEVDETEATEGIQIWEALDMKEATKERQDQVITDEYKKRILEDVNMPDSGELKSDPTIKVADETLLTIQVEDAVGVEKVYGKNKEESAAREDNNTVVGKGSGSNQAAIKESGETLPPQPADQREKKQGILDNKMEEVASGQDGREIDEASAQDQTSTKVAIITSPNMDDRREKNKESAEDSIRSYGKYASDPVNTSCQSSKVGRPSIEEVRRINNGRSLCHLKGIKEPEGTFPAEPSNRMQRNNGGYSSHQTVEEPVLVCKEEKVSMGDSSRVCRRDCAPEVVVIGAPEEISRRRQEACTLQMLEDVQAARLAEKTKMEMEIRILRAQIASMQRQVMNLDYIAEV